jgi:hypothetical protein
MPAQIDADKALFPPDTRNLNYGDPKSKSNVASSGPGTGNGIGTGTGGGVGPGEGGGYGPGRGVILAAAIAMKAAAVPAAVARAATIIASSRAAK